MGSGGSCHPALLSVPHPHPPLPSRRAPSPPACRVVSQCTAGLPEGKPRYVMGIGYPLDIVICSGKPPSPGNQPCHSLPDPVRAVGMHLAFDAPCMHATATASYMPAPSLHLICGVMVECRGSSHCSRPCKVKAATAEGDGVQPPSPPALTAPAGPSCGPHGSSDWRHPETAHPICIASVHLYTASTHVPPGQAGPPA